MDAIDILFVHTNFPAQHKALVERLSLDPTLRLHAIGSRTAKSMPNVNLVRYRFAGGELANTHTFARRFELEARRAEQVIYAANALKLKGVSPKLIFVHPGWGESLPLRTLFPEAKICVYCEFFYHARGVDVGFDPESGVIGIDGATRIEARNAATLLALAKADYAIAPTKWQRSLFPQPFWSMIQVVHDGIETNRLAPAQSEYIDLGSGIALRSGDEVVTYAARNLEPYRGFHVFMRALPELLRARPTARVCIVGGSAISYGAAPRRHKTWKDALLAEIGDRVDRSRVHFVGKLAYESYVALLRLSSLHVYLSYPFALSWSLLEAMSLGCLIVASDNEPITEVVKHNRNGILTSFSEVELGKTMIDALTGRAGLQGLADNARRTIVDDYDFDKMTLPAYRNLIREVRAGCAASGDVSAVAGSPSALSHG
jgi:glycosyltransferase involved in cell wall biosynthesis